MTIRHPDRLLSPASVVVVGASIRPGSVGATVWRNLRSGSFKGPVYGVNPRYAELDGVPTFPAVDRLPTVSELARLTQIDHDREMAFIAEAPDEHGIPETLGVARALSDPDGVEAEFAIIVRSDLKGRGLGALLFERLIEHARDRGTRRLVGHVLRENTRMLRLAHAMGLKADPGEFPDPEVVRMVLELQAVQASATSVAG